LGAFIGQQRGVLLRRSGGGSFGSGSKSSRRGFRRRFGGGFAIAELLLHSGFGFETAADHFVAEAVAVAVRSLVDLKLSNLGIERWLVGL
jgi:hypothetical protein